MTEQAMQELLGDLDRFSVKKQLFHLKNYEPNRISVIPKVQVNTLNRIWNFSTR